MNEHQIRDMFAREIQGGISEDFMNIIDRWIDEGYLSQSVWDAHEKEICDIFDSGWFTCETCGWTMPIEEMSDKEHDHWSCRECIGSLDDDKD